MTGWDSGLWLGLALGLRHALDADHLVAVTGMLSSGRRVRSALGVGLCWGAGHALTLTTAGVAVLASGWHFPESWSRLLEAMIGAVILLLGLNLLRGYRHGQVRWHRHAHGDGGRVHLHLHLHSPESADTARGERVREHAHETPNRLLVGAVGALHGLAGSGPLVILLALSFATPGQRYAALVTSSLASMVGMVVVTAVIAIPYALSHGVGGLWESRLQLATGIGSVLYGFGFAVHALAG